MSRWLQKDLQKRHIDQPPGHLLVWKNSATLQEMLGRTKAGGTPSNKNAYCGPDDRAVQQLRKQTTINKTDYYGGLSYS